MRNVTDKDSGRHISSEQSVSELPVDVPDAAGTGTTSALDQIVRVAYKMLRPLIGLLIRLQVRPNTLTTTGLAINVIAAAVLIAGAEWGQRLDMSYIGYASALILFAGLFDILDGQVARVGNLSTRFGAIYDSVVDRYSELIMFLGICYYFVAHGFFLSSLLAFLAMIGSIMVSYTRARAEGAGISCESGLMQRPVRIVLIGTAGLLCSLSAELMHGYTRVYIGIPGFSHIETIAIFVIPIAATALLSNITAIGRLLACREQLSEHIERDGSGRNENAE